MLGIRTNHYSDETISPIEGNSKYLPYKDYMIQLFNTIDNFYEFSQILDQLTGKQRSRDLGSFSISSDKICRKISEERPDYYHLLNNTVILPSTYNLLEVAIWTCNLRVATKLVTELKIKHTGTLFKKTILFMSDKSYIFCLTHTLYDVDDDNDPVMSAFQFGNLAKFKIALDICDDTTGFPNMPFSIIQLPLLLPILQYLHKHKKRYFRSEAFWFDVVMCAHFETTDHLIEVITWLFKTSKNGFDWRSIPSERLNPFDLLKIDDWNTMNKWIKPIPEGHTVYSINHQDTISKKIKQLKSKYSCMLTCTGLPNLIVDTIMEYFVIERGISFLISRSGDFLPFHYHAISER